MEATEGLLTFLKIMYTLVDQTVKQLSLAGEACPMQSLTELVECVSTKFTPIIYSLIHTLQKGGKKDAHGKKQAKLIPDLIYAIEQLETTLIQISKKTKGNVNLTMYVRRSTTRDFRIDTSVLSKKIENREEREEREEGEEGEEMSGRSGRSGSSSKSKRRKKE